MADKRAVVEAAELAASRERARLADLLAVADKLLRRIYLSGQPPMLSRQTALRLLQELHPVISDASVQRVMPQPARWSEDREELEGALKVAREFIRDHCKAGVKGMPVGRAAEVVEGIDRVLGRPRCKGIVDAAWFKAEEV